MGGTGLRAVTTYPTSCRGCFWALPRRQAQHRQPVQAPYTRISPTSPSECIRPEPTLTLVNPHRVLLRRAPPRISSAHYEAETFTPRMPRRSSTPRRQTTMPSSVAPSARKIEPAIYLARPSKMNLEFGLFVHARTPSATSSPSTSGSSYSKPNKETGR